MGTKSSGAYSPDKALAHPDRLRVLKEGGQPYPVHLNIIISDLCNLDCPKCAYRLSGYSSNELFAGPNGEHNPNRMLDLEVVRGILDDCVAMGVKAAEFTGGGEPTVHPHCADILRYAQKLGLDTALITNGLLLPKVLDEAVRCFWTRVSIDAATENTFGAVRPGLGGAHGENLRRVLTNLEALRNHRDKLGTSCSIGVGFVVQKENWHELYDAVRLYKAHGADNVRISGAFTPERDVYFNGFRLAAEELEERAVADFDGKDGFRVHGRFHEKVEDLAGPPLFKNCWYQHLTAYIEGSGWLSRCCVTSYSKRGRIGNVVTAGGFKKLWDSELKQKAYGTFDARGCPPCQFGDRINAISEALAKDELPEAPLGLQHVNFV